MDFQHGSILSDTHGMVAIGLVKQKNDPRIISMRSGGQMMAYDHQIRQPQISSENRALDLSKKELVRLSIRPTPNINNQHISRSRLRTTGTANKNDNKAEFEPFQTTHHHSKSLGFPT